MSISGLHTHNKSNSADEPGNRDSHACTHQAPPGPRTPAHATTPLLLLPRIGAPAHHARGLCASAASSLMGAARHEYCRADVAHREVRGVRGHNIGCKGIHSKRCIHSRSACHRMVRGETGSRNRRTDLAIKRMSSSSRSRSARAVLSDRDGLYMLKKCSGTRNEKACASIARAMMIQGCAARRKHEKV